MTVIAGCSLIDNVMLIADTRATVPRAGGKNLHVDNVLKLVPLTDTCVVGYSGDIRTARELLLRAIDRVPRLLSRERPDGIVLQQWLPRFFRFTYSQMRRPSDVTFLAAAVIHGYPNVVERQKVVDLLQRFRTGNVSQPRRWIPGVLVDFLTLPAEASRVRIQEAPFGMLCKFRSPRFQSMSYSPLEFAAIGSGESAYHAIDRQSDWIFGGDIGNPAVETQALRNAVSSFVAHNKIASVGGSYTCIRLDAEGCHRCGVSVERVSDRATIELRPLANGGWVQRSTVSGKEILLRYPWEYDWATCRQDQTFDDFDIHYGRYRK